MKFLISYHITDEDYIAFNDHHLRYTPFGRKVVRYCHIALILFSLLLLGLFWLWHHDGFVLACQAVAVAVVCGLWLIFFRRSMLENLRRRVRKAHKAGKELFSPHGELTVDFERGTVTDKMEKMTLEVPFSSIEHYYETPTAFYLYNQPRGGFILPFRAFADANEVAAFREMARAVFQK